MPPTSKHSQFWFFFLVLTPLSPFFFVSSWFPGIPIPYSPLIATYSLFNFCFFLFFAQAEIWISQVYIVLGMVLFTASTPSHPFLTTRSLREVRELLNFCLSAVIQTSFSFSIISKILEGQTEKGNLYILVHTLQCKIAPAQQQALWSIENMRVLISPQRKHRIHPVLAS